MIAYLTIIIIIQYYNLYLYLYLFWRFCIQRLYQLDQQENKNVNE
jgi:hypothetical protein